MKKFLINGRFYGKEYDEFIDKLFIKDKNGYVLELSFYGCLFFLLLGFKLIIIFIKKKIMYFT